MRRSAMYGDQEPYWKTRLKDVVRRNHRHALFGALAEAAKMYLRAYHNEDYYTFNRNGEAFAIETAISQKRNHQFVAFDVGANIGLWAREVLRCQPTSEIHCFEIAPQLRDALEVALRGFDNVQLNGIGLSDQPGPATLKYLRGAETMSSLYDQPLPARWGFQHEEVKVQVTTGDAYVAEHRINHIDFLKVDTEGHDLKVLQGFRNTLEAQLVTLIQFEHGFVHIPAKSLLFDFYQLLEPFRYLIGRLHPTCVDFKRYDNCEDEEFRMGNYIAVHKSNPHLIAALKS